MKKAGDVQSGRVDASALVSRIRRGDTAAFEALCAQIEARLYSFALKCVGNRAEAEDLAQEALLRLYRAARAGRLRTSPRAYAFSIVHNLAMDQHRRNRHIVPMAPRPVPSPAQEAERALLREQIDRAVADLPPDHRSALLLREFGELNYAEIAEALGATLAQVKVWIYRGRKRLSELLDRDGQYVGKSQDGG